MKKNVADRLEGGAELFLQYGLTDLTVHRFRPAVQTKTASKGIALETYGMEMPVDAFGIFSVRQNGAEKSTCNALNAQETASYLRILG